MYKVMKFDDAVKMYLTNGNPQHRLKYYNTGELAIYSMLKEDFPEGEMVESLGDSISTIVKGWCVPNECFIEIANKKENFVEECIFTLKKVQDVLCNVDCTGITCLECPLNIASNTHHCIINEITRMISKLEV